MNRLVWGLIPLYGSIAGFTPTCTQDTAFSSNRMTVSYEFGSDKSGIDALRFRLTLSSSIDTWGAVGFRSTSSANMLDIYSWLFSTSDSEVRDMKATTGTTLPQVDPLQDVETTEYNNTNGILNIEFVVPLNTSDPNDLVLAANLPTYLITAVGPVNGNVFGRHSERQVNSIVLRCPTSNLPQRFLLPDDSSFQNESNITVTYIVPDVEDDPDWLPAFFVGVALLILTVIGCSVLVRRKKKAVQFGKNITSSNNDDNNAVNPPTTTLMQTLSAPNSDPQDEGSIML